jgi:nucleotide-binding universal stress UspA family protein
MYKRIVVAVDGSKAANRGLEEAIRLAIATDGSVRIVHILNELAVGPRYVPMANNVVVNYQYLVDELRAGGRKILDDATALALKAGIVCEGKLIETMGRQAATCIVNEAREWPADLIVMGTHGRRGIRRLALGSDAEMVLRNATVPLLLVREIQDGAESRQITYKKILVPIDGSGASKRGLEEAVRIASSTGATLCILHVVNELVIEPAYLPLLKYDQLLAGLREQGNAILTEATAVAREGGAACESVLLETMGAEAAQSILRQARDWAADLIVMGTHGRRGLRRLALGSDAEIVLRHSPAPLLLVRETPERA